MSVFIMGRPLLIWRGVVPAGSVNMSPMKRTFRSTRAPAGAVPCTALPPPLADDAYGLIVASTGRSHSLERRIPAAPSALACVASAGSAVEATITRAEFQDQRLDRRARPRGLLHPREGPRDLLHCPRHFL